MTDEKHLIDVFVPFFEKHLPQLHQTYCWPVSEKAKSALPHFQWHPKSGSLEECIALKHHLTQTWASATPADKAAIARWIVSDWGGVRANQAATLDSYLQQVTNDAAERPLKGVASYSKILSAADCTQYAIYDARVAACLNAAQLAMDSQRPMFFPYVPGRNTIIQGNKKTKGFVQAFSKQELVNQRGWREVSKSAAYSTYLQLLRTVKSYLPNYEIYHLEMTLFSLAPDLCAKLVNNQSANSL